jgi:hypothetical protein
VHNFKPVWDYNPKKMFIISQFYHLWVAYPPKLPHESNNLTVSLHP